jgi:hypothetical protein
MFAMLVCMTFFYSGNSPILRFQLAGLSTYYHGFTSRRSILQRLDLEWLQ